MRLAQCPKCGKEAWVNWCSIGEICAECWDKGGHPQRYPANFGTSADPADSPRPMIARTFYILEDSSPWQDNAIRHMEDAPAVFD